MKKQKPKESKHWGIGESLGMEELCKCGHPGYDHKLEDLWVHTGLLGLLERFFHLGQPATHRHCPQCEDCIDFRGTGTTLSSRSTPRIPYATPPPSPSQSQLDAMLALQHWSQQSQHQNQKDAEFWKMIGAAIHNDLPQEEDTEIDLSDVEI